MDYEQSDRDLQWIGKSITTAAAVDHVDYTPDAGCDDEIISAVVHHDDIVAAHACQWQTNSDGAGFLEMTGDTTVSANQRYQLYGTGAGYVFPAKPIVLKYGDTLRYQSGDNLGAGKHFYLVLLIARRVGIIPRA